MIIQVNVTNKHAQVLGTPTIVCSNSDYKIQFTFDGEWNTGAAKTARFVYMNGGSVDYTDVVFTGDTVDVPILSNTRTVRVGVFEGNLHTTTPAVIPCELSIRCGTGAPVDPTPSQYDQIMVLLYKGGTQEQLDEIVAAALTRAKESGEFDGPPGPAGKDYVLTQADKAEIAASVVESLGGEPVFGYVDENNNILLQGEFAAGTYNVKYDMQDGTTVNIGTLVLESDNTNYWHVSSLLTKCTNSNKASTVVDGESYSAVITPNSGCTLTSVKVEMGGVDITASAVSGSNISIANVTGSLLITASATETVGGSYTNLFVPSEAILNKRVSSSGSLSDMDGRVVTNFIDVQGKVPFTASTKIYIKGAGFTADGNTKICSYVTTTPAHSDMYSQVNGSALTVTDEGGGVISVQGDSVASTLDDNVKTMCLTLMVSDSAITESDIQNIIITIDEPIA